MANILDRFKETIEEVVGANDGKKIKVGIIGCGWIAEAHVIEYLKMENAILKKAKALRKSFGER